MKKISLSKLYPYTIKEDIANSISHGLGAIVVLILNITLFYKASLVGFSELVVCAIYAYVLMFMMLMSCLYHGIYHRMTRDVFKRLDHSFIFLLITATYLPLVFIGIKTDLSYIIFIILCFVTVGGIFFKVFFSDRFKILSTIIFVVMGWLAVFLIPQMMNLLSSSVLLWILIGGIAYTLGAILYALASFKYHHFIWHIFVLIGAFAHYYAIYLLVS